jgi:hypothetical protein
MNLLRKTPTKPPGGNFEALSLFIVLYINANEKPAENVGQKNK